MIGKRPSLGSGFHGLQQYLLHGRNGASPDRAVWASTRNLPDPEPGKTAAVMEHTAAASLRTEKPVYHLSVSLAPGEVLERPELERIADRLLKDLGLGEHQALVAEHADGAQQHIHLMVNRVHPDTGRAWRTSHDYHRIECSLRAQEQELGLQVVPGRHAPVPGLERYEGTRPGRGAFAEDVREVAGRSFREAEGWQEVHAGLARHGLTVQPSRSGRGLVVTDGKRYVSASKVDREASRPRLEARLGTFEPASPELGKLQEVSQRLEARYRHEAMQTRYRGARRQLDEALARYQRETERVAEYSKKLDQALSKAYRDPATARRRIEGAIERRGCHEAVRILSDRLDAAGQLVGRVGSRGLREAREAVERQVTVAVRDYGILRQNQRLALQRVRTFRRNPRQPVLKAAGHARHVLSRALRRLETLDQRSASERQLTIQAASLAKSVGWRAASRLMPVPVYQAVRINVEMARATERAVGRGWER